MTGRAKGGEDTSKHKEYVGLNEANEQLERHKEGQAKAGKPATEHRNDSKQHLARERVTKQAEA